MALHVGLYYIARLSENVTEGKKGWREKERDREANGEGSLSLSYCPEVNESLARCLSWQLTGEVLMVG